MRIYQPEYYDAFTCIAGECDFTCCQDWSITVDEYTKKKWESMQLPESIKSRALGKCPADYTKQEDDISVIKLCENGKCPFLQSDGLCSMVLQHGEESLSDTCHSFPRERHEFDNRIEYALAVGCKEVLDLLWESDLFYLVSREDETKNVKTDTPKTEEILFEIRDWLMDLVSDPACEVTTSLKLIFYCILDIKEMVDLNGLENEEIAEYMEDSCADELVDEIREAVQPVQYTFEEDNELLLDIMENYRKKNIYSDFIEPIAKRAEFYEQSDGMEDLENKLITFFQIWMQFEEEMRILLCEEIYASCLLPGGDLDSMVMKIEWLGMEYAIIRQWMFLHWELTGKIDIEDLKECIAVVFRMTGYSDEDIEEYLTNSFETPIWDWGYMGLIL